MADILLHEYIEACSRTVAEPVEGRVEPGEFYLRAMLDACASGAALLNEAGTILYVNGAWRELAAKHGLRHERFGVGLNYIEVCRQVSGASVEEAAAAVDGVGQVLLGREDEFQKEYVLPGAGGSRCVLLHAARLKAPGAFRVLVTHEDTALNHWTSESERKHEERLRYLLAATNILPWEADAESGRFTYVGEQAPRMLGYPTERWYEPGFWSAHIHPDDRERAAAEHLNGSKTRDSYEVEYRMLAGDGRTVWLRDTVSVIRRDGRATTFRGFLSDITEHKKTEAALFNLSGRLINAQEEERKRIARELHDDLNQRMALLSIELEQLLQKLQRPRNLRPLIHGLQTKAQEISAEIHHISYRLHPSKLDHLGLAAAVESLCEELSSGCKLKIEFRQVGFPTNVPKDIRLCLFRIAQEALRNCVKHSGARKARVVLEGTGGAVGLSVSDDGCGFDAESGAMESGLGFTSMRERLRLVGGRLRVQSQPLRGTRIEITVPLGAETATSDGETLLLTGLGL